MNSCRLSFAAYAVYGVLLATLATASAADAILVRTEQGWVQGSAGLEVRDFKGIPFAHAPIGRRRFAPPEAALAWRGTLDATQYRSACPQVSRFGLTDASDEEDCLFLNVTVPAAAAQSKAKRPVLVWLHGGAYVGGSSNLYPLDYLARTGDLVVVSVNYRIGALGFMAHPALSAAHNGSLGLEDQRMALRWVKRNIAAFGGDPANVTLAGESAGAASVCMQLLAVKESSGLFQKAIIQSIGCPLLLDTAAEALQYGRQIAALLHCDDMATAVACLRSKSIHELLDAQVVVGNTNPHAFTPSVGSLSIPSQGASAFASGRFVKVPMINGGNRDEMRLYVAYAVAAGQAVTADTYPVLVKAIYGDIAPDVLAEYPLANYLFAPSALGTIESDFIAGGPLSNCLFLDMAERASRYVPVYQYEFADRTAPPVMDDPGFEMGAVHAAELPYFFPHISHNSKINGPDLGPASQRLSESMIAYWSSFAHGDRPAPVGLPAWPRYHASGDVMRFAPDAVGTFDASAEHHCDFWRSHYASLTAPR